MTTTRARQLRSNPTDAEIRLWSKLRRQAPIGPYYVDFVCLEKKLILEIDGGQHAVRQDFDAKRTRWLESEGYRVIRFWNNEVLGNLDGVLESIRRALVG